MKMNSRGHRLLVDAVSRNTKIDCMNRGYESLFKEYVSNK